MRRGLSPEPELGQDQARPERLASYPDVHPPDFDLLDRAAFEELRVLFIRQESPVRRADVSAAIRTENEEVHDGLAIIIGIAVDVLVIGIGWNPFHQSRTAMIFVISNVYAPREIAGHNGCSYFQ